MMTIFKLIAVVLALTAVCMGYYARRLARRFDTIQKAKEDWIFAGDEYNKETVRTMVFICLIVALLYAVTYMGLLCCKHNVPIL